MAHKGSPYKLWFRRDANWNLNNYNYGYPECYLVRGNDFISSPRYAVARFGDVDGVNLNKDYLRKWTSPTYGSFFDNVYWTLELQGPVDESITQARFGIWHQALIDTPLFTATYKCSQVVLGYESVFLSGLVQLHYLSPDVTVDPETFRVFFQAARYGRYNP